MSTTTILVSLSSLSIFQEGRLYSLFAYAGPVIGVIAWNAIGSLIGIVCVYAFLNRKKLKKYRFLNFITKPFHKLIV